MRKPFLYFFALISIVLGMGACELDESITTTELAGNWFVNRVDMINAKSLDSEDYKTINTKQYDAYSLKEGSLLFVAKETSNFNEYLVAEYKYEGTKWKLQKQERVRISSSNKFAFNNRQCKFKKGNAELLEIKAKYGSEYYLYRFEKTMLNPYYINDYHEK